MSGLVPFSRGGSLFNTGGRRGLYNMLDDFFSDPWMSERSLVLDTFKVDVKEDEKAYAIDAELPGVQKEEINLALTEGRLTISVEKEEKTEDKKENYVHKERRYGSVSRSIYLADAASEGIEAKLEDGLLKITVPKKEKSGGPNKIIIK